MAFVESDDLVPTRCASFLPPAHPAFVHAQVTDSECKGLTEDWREYSKKRAKYIKEHQVLVLVLSGTRLVSMQ
jgi:hypothetical protein